MPVGVNLPSRLKPIGTKFIAMRGKLQPAAARGCGCRRAHLRRRADAPRDRWAIAKRHFVRRRRETALCGERCGPSPRDPSSVHPRASAAQLRLGVQPLRGLGSGAVPLRCRTIAVRMRRSCGRLAAAKSPSVVLRAARGCDDAAAVRACVRPVAQPIWDIGMFWDVLGRFGTFWDVCGRPCETVTWPFQLERRKQRATNSPTKRPFAALEQRPGGPHSPLQLGASTRIQPPLPSAARCAPPSARLRAKYTRAREEGPLAHSQGIFERQLQAVTEDFGNLHELPQSAQPGSRNC